MQYNISFVFNLAETSNWKTFGKSAYLQLISRMKLVDAQEGKQDQSLIFLNVLSLLVYVVYLLLKS